MLHERPTMTVREASARLGMKLTTARRIAAEGKLPGQLPRIGTSDFLISVKGLEEYLASYYLPSEDQ